MSESDCTELAQFAQECTAFSVKLTWNWPNEGIFANELLNDRDKVAYVAVLAILAFIARFIKLTLDLKNGTFLKQVQLKPTLGAEIFVSLGEAIGDSAISGNFIV